MRENPVTYPERFVTVRLSREGTFDAVKGDDALLEVAKEPSIFDMVSLRM